MYDLENQFNKLNMRTSNCEIYLNQYQKDLENFVINFFKYIKVEVSSYDLVAV